MSHLELAEYDDIASTALEDSVLGFTAHKMSIEFCGHSVQELMKKADSHFKRHKNHEKTYIKNL